MGLMDGVLGGLVGAGVTAAIQNYIQKQGGDVAEREAIDVAHRQTRVFHRVSDRDAR